jgi:hypothetical protein
VAHEDRHRILWDKDLPTTGYWLWVEIPMACPRVQVLWNTLCATSERRRLLALVEYVVAWWALKVQGTVLDGDTWCWLRTKYDFAPGPLGALFVDGSAGEMSASGRSLGESYKEGGGRFAEVVQAVA